MRGGVSHVDELVSAALWQEPSQQLQRGVALAASKTFQQQSAGRLLQPLTVTTHSESWGYGCSVGVGLKLGSWLLGRSWIS